ncbi:MAG TPA: hypothetical protein PLD14_00940 [Candidatus Pacearchaeota archaeon]|nr:hypothetical protein [Candidatus Pacearchaeota archaeon]HPR79765.1 hypothetical protein [Candidatus Pacearchaeota archaeon]
MFKFKKIKIIACSLFIFLIIILPLGNILAADPFENIANLWFMGPTSIPAGILLTGLQYVNLLPETKEGGDINNPVDFVFSGIAKFGYTLLYTGSTALLTLGQSLLGYVIDGNFTGMGITDFNTKSPTYNPVVAEGWGIVRNIANAALIIGLVIIAINIIIGREENKAKKTLVNFIIIALLINFTPVLCGFLIDGCNIVTKSFITGGINPAFSNSVLSSFDDIRKKIPSQSMTLIFAGIIFLIFSLISFFIYVLYAILFAARYVILWILVIASPIAFATKVFPQSKYIRNIFPSILYWDDWIQSFVQWCTIGIPAGLFIYLSNMMITTAQKTPAPTSSGNIITDVIGGLLIYFIPLLFLIAGFFVTISTGGQVGSFVGGIATGAWAMSGGKIAGRLMGGVKDTAERSLTLAKEGIAGTGGAILTGKTPLSFENREEGRRTLDKLSFGAPSAKDDKEAAQDYLKKHPGAYDFKTREGLKRTELNKDVGEYIDGAKTPDELKAIIKDIETLGSQKTKDMAAIKLAGKTDILKDGYSNFVNNTDNKINITNKIEGMSAKTAQKDISAKALGNYDIFKNLNVKQIDYIADQGSEKQRQAMKEMIWGSGNAEFAKKMSDLVLKSQNKVAGKTFTPKEMAEAKAEYDKNVENIQALLNKKIV